MARGNRQIQSNLADTRSSAAGSAADAGTAAGASAAPAGYESHLAAIPEGLASPMSVLPNELIQFFGSYLSNSEAAALSQTSRLFRANMNNARNPASMANRHVAQNLLLCVANGEEEAVAAILQERPDLLTMRTLNFYDVHTDTQFVGVSAWEYALWAGDTRYMANRMLDCIPETPIGADIKSIVAQQYERHNLVGLDCITKDGTPYDKKHFDFTPLLDAYARFIAAVDAMDEDETHTPLTTAPTWVACHALFLAVGREQRKLPVHVRQHYCDLDTAFYPLPTFQAEKLKRCLTFHNCVAARQDVWGSGQDSSLGVEFIIFRANLHRSHGVAHKLAGPLFGLLDMRPRVVMLRDACAITKLCEVRTNADYAALVTRLASDLNPTPGAAAPAGLR